MEPSEPLRHHFIPEFYLRWWTGPDDRLTRWTKPFADRVVVKRVFPSQVGWERGLYTSPEPNSADAQRLETRFFQHVDHRAAEVLRKLNAETIEPINEQDATAWTTFIMSIFHRTPENLAAIKQGGQNVWRDTIPELRERYPELRTASDPATFDEFLAQRQPSETDRSTLDILPDLIFNQNIVGFINGLSWVRLEIPAPLPQLLISDDPVIRTNGLRTPKGHLAMPLSPRKLFVAAWREETLLQVRHTPIEILVSKMNTWMVEGARHFVGGADDTYDAYIRDNFGRLPKAGIGRSIS